MVEINKHNEMKSCTNFLKIIKELDVAGEYQLWVKTGNI